EGVQTADLDEYDALLDGENFPHMDLPDDSAVSPDEATCMRNFDAAINAIKDEICGCCHEEGFNIQLKASGNCSRCHGDRRDVKMWSDANNVNPMPENQRPACVKNLTEMEEMLIARIKPVMQVRWTRG
ncbi:hypothetical protein B0H14DRAFT_2238188, partial [Mycena olivaceomarginata]